MGRLIKQALYSYQYEQERRFKELDRKRSLMKYWLNNLYPSHGFDKYVYVPIRAIVKEGD